MRLFQIAMAFLGYTKASSFKTAIQLSLAQENLLRIFQKIMPNEMDAAHVSIKKLIDSQKIITQILSDNHKIWEFKNRG